MTTANVKWDAAIVFVVILSCCTALASTAPVSAAYASETGSKRSLLQSPNQQDCKRSVPFCNKCRFQFVQGSTTRAICTECDAGYNVKKKGRACWCAPGYYSNDTVSNTCEPCGDDHWCPGARLSLYSAQARVPCGAMKTTNSRYARSERECLALPGFGWGSPDAYECPVGYYNPGNNNRRCTRCPGGLTTVATQTRSAAEGCVAPQGYYYLRGRAMACARGTFKEAAGNGDCAPCPVGFTTAANKVAHTSKEACGVLLPGYATAGPVTPGTTEGDPCPEGAYRAGELNTTGATQAITCQPCGQGMSTQPNVTGSTSPDACLVIPGYGFNADSTPTFQGTATKCAVAKYNEGWNREACTSCGLGSLATDGQGSTSPDDCYVPAGHGTNRSADGTVLMSFACPLDTYGRPNNTYGLVDSPCSKCPDHTRTNATASIDGSRCLTVPGYGWYDGQVLECEYGYYSPGYSQNKCEYCGQGRNTSVKQSVDESACEIDYGWTTDGHGGIKPCLRGLYKDQLGSGNCSVCPSGTTTTITVAATDQSDCNACLPGYGKSSISPSSPACDMCTSGFYSPGLVEGGASCAACPLSANFTGKMVSRPGINTPEYCVPEFPTDASLGLENDQDYDIISMPSSYLTLQASAANLSSCQRGCSADGACQYFEWRNYTGECYFKKGPSAIVNPTASNLTSSDSFILFEVSAGVYAAYLNSDGNSTNLVGQTLANLTNSSITAAVAACDASAACIGVTHDDKDGSKYRLFKGTKWQDAVGKVRVVGETLNAWIDICNVPGTCSVNGTAACSAGVCTCKSGYSGNACDISSTGSGRWIMVPR